MLNRTPLTLLALGSGLLLLPTLFAPHVALAQDAAPPADPAAAAGDATAPVAEPAADAAVPPAAAAADTPPATEPSPAAAAAASDASPGFSLPMWGQDSPAPAEAAPKAEREPQAGTENDTAQVFSDDWWSHTRPVLELHGYFRVRAEGYHRLDLGRVNPPQFQLGGTPLDRRYTASDGQTYGPALCTPNDRGDGTNNSPTNLGSCNSRTMAGANLRLRFAPELHISDNLRVITQIDMLDNLVMGTTPSGYSYAPASSGGYATQARPGSAPLAVVDNTQVAPQAGVNSASDSVQVKRAWGEYQTPLGELRFGRMPSHWGLGMIWNSGDGYDDDYSTTVDRIMAVTGIPALDLYIMGAWDFPAEGATTAMPGHFEGQPLDAAQEDDVDQYVLSVVHRKSPEMTKLALAKGKMVFQGGGYLMYRRQLLANDQMGIASDGANVPGAYPKYAADEQAYNRRGANIWIPDLWAQFQYKKFSFDVEAATIQGSIENTEAEGSNYATYEGWKFREWGVATELQQKFVEDQLRLTFKFGWASGDPDASDTSASGDRVSSNALTNTGDGFQPQLGDDTISTFSFHPNYKVDMILYRQILKQVSGTYYFRPAVEYDALSDPTGQRLGGGLAAIWSRASEFMQAPGHARDLGIELNAKLYYQARDGALNDSPDRMGGFYTSLEYGVLFPFSGLGYQKAEQENLRNEFGGSVGDVKAAQALRWYLGVLF